MIRTRQIPSHALLLAELLFSGIPLLSQTQAAGPQQNVEPVRTTITVTEKISTETPSNVTEETAQDLEQIPGVNLDDRLRQIPGFSLFRRTPSTVANPTQQGVSLRGIGSSGASRTLVLFDGIPVNDPFGGWIYWTRFIPEDLQRVEISRGASTSAFGDLAMGGVIGIFPREPRKHFSAGYEIGNETTNDLWMSISNIWSHWAVSASGRAFSTDGYYVVPADVRGSADRPAAVQFFNSSARVDWFSGNHRVFAEFNMLAEDRKNGTVLQKNSTGLGTISLHYAGVFGRNTVSLLGFRTQEAFRASFSAITTDRNSERLTFRQRVPSEANGGALLWSHAGSNWNTIVGTDVNRAHGFSIDTLFPSGQRIGGGTVLQHGEFVQSNMSFGRLKLLGGARHQFTVGDHQFFSPSAGFVYGGSRWRVRSAVYKAFRAPTLNELYREFRVGNATTLANPLLTPETLFGSEIGADYIAGSGAFRVTAFRNSIGHLITNFTVSSSPAEIIRQRRNAANALGRGVEIAASKRWHNWHGELGYLFADNRLVTGPRIPQVPKHQGSGQIGYSREGTTISMGLRSYSTQFEDDRNQFLMPGFATVQFLAQQHLHGRLSATLAIENLLDHEYITGFTPTPNIGNPRLIRLGLLWQ